MSDIEREVRWEYLLPKEFGEAVADCPVCYMPLGTLERHGAHLPFGLDGMKAHGLCLATARRYGGVVLPALHWGTHGWWAEGYRRGDETKPGAKQPPGSVYIYEGLLINLFLSMFREVEYAGFKVIVTLTGHYPQQQLAAVRNAAAQHMCEGQAKIWALCDADVSGQPEMATEHAGKWETSILWALYPDLVKMDRCPDPETGLFAWCNKTALEASPEAGQRMVDYIADQLGAGAARLLSEAL